MPQLLKDRRMLYILGVILVIGLNVFISARACEPKPPEEPSVRPVDMQVTVSSSGDAVEHINARYSDSFVVDADILRSAPDSADVLAVRYRIFDEQALTELFFRGEQPRREEHENGDMTLRGADGSYVYAGTNGISTLGGFHYRDAAEPYYRFVTDSFVSRDGTTYAGEIESLVFDRVYKRESLDFMTREQAVAEARRALDRLSMNVSDEVDIYAVDCETMQSYQDERKKKEPDAVPHYKIKDVFTKDDEFYALFFTATQSGIPISPRGAVSGAIGSEADGSWVKVCLSAQGILLFDTGSFYEVESVVKTERSFVTPQQAIDRTFELYSAPRLSSSEFEVKEVSFEYREARQGGGGRLRLVPAWAVTVEHKPDPQRDLRIIEVRFIEAATGEEVR